MAEHFFFKASGRKLAWMGILGVCAWLIAGCRPPGPPSEKVELVLSTEGPGPDTIFEVRFPKPMAKPEQLASEEAESPVLFSPALPGTFQWTSERVGTYVPLVPLALDTRYQVRLRPGLRYADGQPCRGEVRETVQTPPFTVVWHQPSQASTNASSKPEVSVLFNAAVDAGQAARYFEFRDEQGRRVAARVRQGAALEMPPPYSWGMRGVFLDWEGRFARHLEFRPRPSSSWKPAEYPKEITPNLCMVTPAEPLRIGQGWKLVVGAGVPAAGMPLRMGARVEVPIGDVHPFTYSHGSVDHIIHRQPQISIYFSKALNSALQQEWTNYVTISPAADNVTAAINGARMILHGNFSSQTDYTVKLARGLPAEEPFALGDEVSLTVDIPPVDPRLYFSEFKTAQMATGQRHFPLLAVNVPHVRVRAKLLDPAVALYALRGYDSYHRKWSDRPNPDERHKALDYNLVPGRTIYEVDLVGQQEVDEPVQHDLDWNVILGGRTNGVVFLDARRVGEGEFEGPLGTQAIIQLTDLGVTWKISSSKVQAFVFSHATGRPVPEAEVSLFDGENQSLAKARTDTNGVAVLPAFTNAMWIVAQLGSDYHALALDANHVSFYREYREYRDSDYGSTEVGTLNPVLLFSDREVYAPGETLHLKMIVRDWTDGRLRIPDKAQGTLIINGPREEVLLRTNVSFGSLGSCGVSVPLAIETRGECQAQLEIGGRQYTHLFQVQEYQPPAFEIAMTPKPEYGPVTNIVIPVAAKYYFGQPLSRAQIKWTARAEDTILRMPGYEDFDFATAFQREVNWILEQGQSGITNGVPGSVALALPLAPEKPRLLQVRLSVDVTDLNQQTLSRSVEFIRHSSEFYLGLRRPKAVIPAGEPAPLEVLAVGADGKPWPKAVEAKLTIARLTWETVKVQGAGRSTYYRNEAVFSNILERVVTVTPAVARAGTNEPPVGMRLAEPLPDVPGTYVATLSARDSEGRNVQTTIEFQLSASGWASWEFRNDARLNLKADKKEYQPGDTALILLEAPIRGTALVSIEREQVLRTFVTQVEGNAPAIRVPIEPGDAPNLFVTVTLVRGAQDCPREVKEPEFYTGRCELGVSDPQTRLAVQINPAQPRVLPRQPVEVAVVVRDSAGQPAADAEVTLYAVDEGVLSLMEEGIPDPHRFFYARREHGVETAISLPTLMTEDPDRFSFHNKGYLGGGGGEDAVRRNFLACAFWQDSARTDQEGRVVARFEAPDSLTRYRVVAVAIQEVRFGSAQASFEVAKPLALEPALPRLARVGDRVQARAVLHNLTDQPGEAEVTLQLDDKARPGAGTENGLARRVRVEARKSVAVEFPLEILEPGQAQWIWKARFVEADRGQYQDAVQSTLELGYPTPALRQVLIGRMSGGQTNLLQGADPQLLKGRGTVTVRVANTRLIGLGESVAKLLHYPYGCVEQTSSSLLPWVVLRGTSVMEPLVARRGAEVDRALAGGVSRLFRMQTHGGGLSYWPGQNDPMFWGSAYAGVVLALAKSSEVPVPERPFDRLTKYLARTLRETNVFNAQPDAVCLALYALALAGEPEAAYHEKLFGMREQLSGENRALLALAILESGGPAEMAGELLASKPKAVRSDLEHFGGPAREHAIRLLAWVRFQPQGAETDALVAELVGEQRNGDWSTTQGNAWSLLALTRYARTVEQGSVPVQVRLSGATTNAVFSLSSERPVWQQQFTLAPESAEVPLQLQSEGGPLFAIVTIESRPAAGLPLQRDQGFGLRREYQRLDDENRPGSLDGLRIGDRVLVTLRLEVRQGGRYVALDDALPAQFEIINTAFKSTGESGSFTTADPPDVMVWPGDYHEYRTDRALFFADYLSPGHYVVRYLARVRAAAAAVAPSAKVEEMYHPERYGLSELRKVESQSAN